MDRRWLFVTVACALAVAAGCTHQAPVGTATSAPATNAAATGAQPKVAQKMPQAAIDTQIYQINHSPVAGRGKAAAYPSDSRLRKVGAEEKSKRKQGWNNNLCAVRLRVEHRAEPTWYTHGIAPAQLEPAFGPAGRASDSASAHVK